MTVTDIAVSLTTLVPTAVNIPPNDTELPGIPTLRTIVGAVMTVGLIFSALALIISAVVWAFGANSANPHLASRGKTSVLISCGAAILCGAAVVLVNSSGASARPSYIHIEQTGLEGAHC